MIEKVIKFLSGNKTKKSRLNIAGIVGEIKRNIGDLQTARTELVAENKEHMAKQEELQNKIDTNTTLINTADKMKKKLQSVL